MRVGEHVRYSDEFIARLGFQNCPEATMRGTIRAIEILGLMMNPETALAYVAFTNGDKRWVNVRNITRYQEV